MLVPFHLIRERWHVRRRDRKLAQAVSLADVLVCSHAKSGRTWLRAMVSHIYHQLYATPPELLIHNDNLQQISPRIPFVYFGDGVEVRSRLSGKLLARAQPHQRAVFLLRDPRDVAVSFYHHLRERATPRELLRKHVPEEVLRLDLFEFVLHEDFGLPRVIDRFNQWSSDARKFDRVAFVTYEALWTDGTSELGRVMQVLGERVSTPTLQKAVNFASFDSLQEKERNGFFQGERLMPTMGRTGPAYKVREGGIHGHRKLFTPEQLSIIDKVVEERLNSSIGYTDSTDLEK